jgi:hypothetical protein
MEPGRIVPVAVGSEPAVAATISSPRITIGSRRPAVVEATLVSAASSSSPPHAPKQSALARTNTTVLPMTAP